jgi:hypothetical protein
MLSYIDINGLINRLEWFTEYSDSQKIINPERAFD